MTEKVIEKISSVFDDSSDSIHEVYSKTINKENGIEMEKDQTLVCTVKEQVDLLKDDISTDINIHDSLDLFPFLEPIQTIEPSNTIAKPELVEPVKLIEPTDIENIEPVIFGNQIDLESDSSESSIGAYLLKHAFRDKIPHYSAKKTCIGAIAFKLKDDKDFQRNLKTKQVQGSWHHKTLNMNNGSLLNFEKSTEKIIQKIESTYHNGLHIEPVKKRKLKLLPILPLISDKLMKIIDDMVIKVDKYTIKCMGCNTTVQYIQSIIFPHIRNCKKIHCFRKWMFNFDAVKNNISYATKENFLSRWNNTKLIADHLDYEGFYEFLLLKFQRIENDYQCRFCHHICHHVAEKPIAKINLFLLNHLLACSIAIEIKYDIVQALYIKSFTSEPLKDKYLKREHIIPIEPQIPIEWTNKDTERTTLQIQMMNTQIKRSNNEVAMYKELKEARIAELELEIEKYQLEIVNEFGKILGNVGLTEINDFLDKF